VEPPAGDPARDSCRLTLIGAATVLIECGSFRLLTDPVFDPAGTRYTLRILGVVQIPMRKTSAPAIAPEALGRLDAVLLSHEGHADNLDHAGRALLGRVPVIVTTPVGAARLGSRARGLATWTTTELTAADGSVLRITSTPARHGPPGSLSIVGPVTGFLLEWAGQRLGALYLSGDTVWYQRLTEIGRRFRVSAAFLHLGGAGFPISGPIRYTMTARDIPRVVQALGVRTVVPIHCEGWQHFQEPAASARETLVRAQLGATLVWPSPGQAVTIPV
jgi:L-ascorbate metabolism protein UlaG (beta-lactamase superfamily)